MHDRVHAEDIYVSDAIGRYFEVGQLGARDLERDHRFGVQVYDRRSVRGEFRRGRNHCRRIISIIDVLGEIGVDGEIKVADLGHGRYLEDDLVFVGQELGYDEHIHVCVLGR